MRARFVLFLPAAALLAAREARAGERADILSWMGVRDVKPSSCGGCQQPARIDPISYELKVSAPADLAFERFEVGGNGRIEITAISPNGRTVLGTLYPGRRPGKHRVVAFFMGKDGTRATRTETFRVDLPHRGPDCIPAPCNDPPSPGDLARIAAGRTTLPPCHLEALGPLSFATLEGESAVVGRWPERLHFTVALPEATSAAARPEVKCTTGSVLSIVPLPPVPGMRDRFHVEVASEPPAVPHRLVAGPHHCTVAFALADGGDAGRLAGTLPFRIDDEGQVHTPPARCPKPSPPPRGEGPLPVPGP
jgi:hypothetical protein